MTVLSQKGASYDSGFIVRRKVTNRSELALPHARAAGWRSRHRIRRSGSPLGEQQGPLLALVYNAFANDALLYVDGQLAASATVNHAQAWNASRGSRLAGPS